MVRITKNRSSSVTRGSLQLRASAGPVSGGAAPPPSVRPWHGDGLREERHRDKTGFEIVFEHGILKVGAFQVGVALQEAIERCDATRVCGAQEDLREKLIRVERNRREQLVEPAGGARTGSGLRAGTCMRCKPWLDQHTYDS